VCRVCPRDRHVCPPTAPTVPREFAMRVFVCVAASCVAFFLRVLVCVSVCLSVVAKPRCMGEHVRAQAVCVCSCAGVRAHVGPVTLELDGLDVCSRVFAHTAIRKRHRSRNSALVGGGPQGVRKGGGWWRMPSVIVTVTVTVCMLAVPTCTSTLRIFLVCSCDR